VCKKLPHTSTNLLVHLIFSTKRSYQSIAPEIKGDLFAYMGGIIRAMDGIALIVNGTANHVNLLVRIPPICSVAEMARVLKANSSRWAHEKWPQHTTFAWQAGYGAFSVSESSVQTVTKYIAKQEEHHRRRSFQEEYMEFLRKNGIAYEEKYLWD
jgi:REP-associated tyrosine transposase